MEEEKNPEVQAKEEIVAKRGNRLFSFVKKPWVWSILILIILVFLAIQIRIQPMTDHGNGRPGLWDITTNTWTLGPDLDPWLFFRYARYIINGNLPPIDGMRNVPLGFDMSKEAKLLSYMIAYTYKVTKIFYPAANLEFSADIFPVVMFVLTLIIFFLFVREIFVRKEQETKIKANVIALIASLFLVVIPSFLPRTVAGIPEKESAAFFFLFFAFYLFLKAWKSEKMLPKLILGILAGIATGAMGLVWGGVLYAFITIALATLIAFLLNKVSMKEFIMYTAWMLSSFLLMLISSTRFAPSDLIASLDTGSVCLVFIILAVHFIIWWALKDMKFLEKIKLPKNIFSIIVAFVVGIVLFSIIFGPSFIFDKLGEINRVLISPTTGRWQVTVAENRQPYFSEWSSTLGPFLGKIPITFWLFFAGSLLLVKNMFGKLKKKDSWILTGLYALFFFGVVFSRYAAHPALFDGEGILSRLFYYGSALLLFGAMIYYYMKYQKEKDDSFDKTDFEYILTISLLLLCLVTARSAVRLIMVLATVAPILIGYLIVEVVDMFRKNKALRLVLGIAIIFLLLLSSFVVYNFYKEVKSISYSYVPSYYTQQWQKAMDWVRDTTPTTSVFAHWWDYGYWVQSIGNRATVTDGGNAITFWNYYTGRLVLTGDNQEDALDFLYNHNSTHLLIDSSDIGKYGAFSSIGSDINYDRLSWIPTFILDEKQTIESKNNTSYVYTGGTSLDEDLILNNSGDKLFLPANSAGLAAIVIPVVSEGNLIKFEQPYGVFLYQQKQYNYKLKYIYYNDKLIDFGSGIEAAAFVVPKIIQSGQGISQNNLGALMYISPRVLRGMLARLYLFNNALGNFPNFEIAHTEPNIIIAELNAQGANLPEFIYFNGIQGPIKIWEINYTGGEKFKQEYLDRDASKYLTWKL